ncbi:MAG: FAD-linked oxidase [Gammaproteobacteria bacterium]|nr:FAD-linked oxidase [Gammaproteobacteria bacterium]
MQLHGWGRFPRADAELIEPPSAELFPEIFKSERIKGSLIARGGGRSYGDSALSKNIISSRFLDNFLEFDETSETIRCGAGVSIDMLLRTIIPTGYFLPVLPGTGFVSVGGAIAADIHGKNHHTDGSFCDHLVRFSLLLASGEIIECSPKTAIDAFIATCGGMGLTGVILDATLKLEKVPSVCIKRESIVAANLEDCFDLIEDNESSKYSVAWIDCLAKKNALGRSILHLAEHNATGLQKYKSRRRLSIPFNIPAFLVNKHTTRLFNNSFYHLRKRTAGTNIVNYDSYFFPLDNIKNWNRVFGQKGFFQYQLVIPSDSAKRGMKEILNVVANSGKGSFISVLKKFSKSNENLLSFPEAGYTLTLDFKNEPGISPLMKKLDDIVLAHCGRLYLAKDARMSEDMFKKSYSNWEKFIEIKNRLDPNGKFASIQSDRIGLT